MTTSTWSLIAFAVLSASWLNSLGLDISILSFSTVAFSSGVACDDDVEGTDPV